MPDSYGLLAIGGGPAGLEAARAYRDADGEGPVAIVTDEQRMPYNRPPLSKELLRGETGEDSLPLEPEAWLAEQQVELIAGRGVSLDAERRELTLSGGRVVPFRRCVLATGGEPARLPIPGADDPAVRVVRTLDHVRELLHRLRPALPVAVIGSGFIGCEIAASLRMRGHPVTVLSDEPAPNARRLGERVAGRIAAWLEADGVDLQLGAEVHRIDRTGELLRVSTDRGGVTAALVVMAAGITPRAELAQSAGIELRDGAIPVDASMLTAQPDVLAAGDVCLAENAAAGRTLRVEHWGEALRHGQIAGRVAAGAHDEWSEVPGFWSSIGHHTLKYAAWGDGFDEARLTDSEAGFTVEYGRAGRLVGLLTDHDDDAYAQASERISQGAPWN